MSLVLNVFFALIYLVISGAAAVSLPRLVPGLSLESALIAGGAMLLGFAVLHEALARQGQHRALAREVDVLRGGQDTVMAELSRAREELGLICDALTATRGAKASKDLRAEFDTMVGEVRLLQTLVDQLSTKADARGGATAPRPRMTVNGDGIASDAGGAQATVIEFDDASILKIIQDGLRRDRLDLVLQPIVSLPQRKRKFIEAFTRIRAEDGSVIVPAQYIAIAEREGLITAIDNMLLFRCVQLLRKTHARNKHLGFFCNISPYTLADHAFFQDFVEFMSENAELAPNLIFELSQATVANRDDHIMRQMSRLARLGFRFSMDQVASLNLDYSMLASQYFRFVKIEAATMLAEVDNPTAGLDIDVGDLKRTLDRHGIDLIVEKIETEPLLLEVLDFHIDFGQGYLFGEPKVSEIA
jgi:cyclic-di-GMP phosphodiesterase TipF (flagellum assembly factor)